MEVKHESGIFYIGKNKEDYQTKVTYTFFRDDVIVIKETRSKKEYRGQGQAKKVLAAVIEWAREKDMKILPECPYASKVMRENDDYTDMIFSDGKNESNE